MRRQNPFTDYDWRERARDDLWPAGTAVLLALLGGLMSVI